MGALDGGLDDGSGGGGGLSGVWRLELVGGEERGEGGSGGSLEGNVGGGLLLLDATFSGAGFFFAGAFCIGAGGAVTGGGFGTALEIAGCFCSHLEADLV